MEKTSITLSLFITILQLEKQAQIMNNLSVRDYLPSFLPSLLLLLLLFYYWQAFMPLWIFQFLFTQSKVVVYLSNHSHQSISK